MQELTRAKKIRSIVAASSGNLVEWFDFYIYAFTATYFAHTFSTSDNPIVQQINAFGVFAAGFFMRPIGSWLFGSLADKVGRKKSMVVSVVLMALGSFMIAALPSKDVVGDFAIILLLLARLIQGLSVGGEYGIAATYLSELATEGKRGFYSSFQYVTLIGGQLLAVASISIMLFFFSIDEMKDYAWRILFVVGGILALGSLLVRKVMNESATQIHKHEDRGTLKALFTSSWKQFLMVLGITAGGSLAFYTITTYTKTFMENSGMDKTLVNNLFLGALFILMIIQPLFGYIGDKIGHKRSLIIFCILAFVGIYPIFNLISSNAQSNASLVFILVVLLFIILSFYTSVAGIFKAKLFPEHVRALGTGLGYAISNAIFGGSAPWVALQFKNAGMENGFFVYIAVLTLLMFIATLCLPKKSELN
ncbi:MFS transporter [Campylobacter coli]|uniref:MFS transporter n=1 Tax=Campylobacter TaxID=194 RepID=UPI000257D1F3|nr:MULTISPECIES: MFS transporter [Campylobacter]EAK3888288.1 MFS transporter [Campylobacter hyointestinalis]EAL3816552.1 MFS transporter [Campylobacter fetus]EAL7883779.1 MFS transporter [Campylobacter jejuni]EIA70943.1 alpha-ketoglutarate permease [Campylobacter coli 7--1]EIA73228.1 alpha-ketoglutarate permease [Campylobacter coli 1891]EIA75253.1 alpha-ketoglutarate permease [Campylobacter coli 132-6]EIA87573.1 alpha-ketoglutarate permease [Campylobacter coli 67-8]